jgi:heat shock protein HslJ
MSPEGSSPAGPSAATPDGSLVGPTWRLVTIAGQPVIEGATVTAEFSTENRVSGRAGCNLYFGSAEAQAGSIEVGRLGSTLMACAPEGVMEQETRYLSTLQAAKSYAVSGDELRLGPSADEVTLVFTSR